MFRFFFGKSLKNYVNLTKSSKCENLLKENEKRLSILKGIFVIYHLIWKKKQNSVETFREFIRKWLFLKENVKNHWLLEKNFVRKTFKIMKIKNPKHIASPKSSRNKNLLFFASSKAQKNTNSNFIACHKTWENKKLIFANLKNIKNMALIIYKLKKAQKTCF